MEKSVRNILIIISAVLIISVSGGPPRRRWLTPDELENHISPEDLRDFLEITDSNVTTTPRSIEDSDTADIEPLEAAELIRNTRRKGPQDAGCIVLLYGNADALSQIPTSTRVDISKAPVPAMVDCFGLGSVSRSIMKFFNMKPDNSESINTHFYFSSRTNPSRVQVYPGEQFGLDWVDFKPERRTVMIVHGFMSHSNASWVNDMVNAFLAWGDVNVIAVDWSGGGNTWKYWRAVANTRRVGSDIHKFMRQLINATGARTNDFHFVGHSLGAHISSFASHLLGGVSRITGLDPAQPCFATTDDVEKLDKSDADFVDIIHTNGRMLEKFGFGMPEPMGHADFYPNGGIKQPGCTNSSRSMWARMISFTKIQQAVCSHGRAYVLFTESLINNNCSFRAHKWDLSYHGVNRSLNGSCNLEHSCAEMGIGAVGSHLQQRALGQYILLTTDREPYCVSPKDPQPSVSNLLQDIRAFSEHITTTVRSIFRGDEYADPELVVDDDDNGSKARDSSNDGSSRGWLSKWFGRIYMLL